MQNPWDQQPKEFSRAFESVPGVRYTRKNRTMAEKKTRYWFDFIQQTEQVFSEAAPACKSWYQLDRGADFREMLIWAAPANSLVTVRCTQDRLTEDPGV